jgi:hypothetical protein
MIFTSVLQYIDRMTSNHGYRPLIYDFLMRSVNKCVYYRTLQCLVIDQVDERCQTLPVHLRFAKLDELDLLSFAENPECELTVDFVRQAAKGDECYAILDGDLLASYGWYSREPTLTNSSDLILHFDPKYIYMYKAFTLERYRGQRLHAVGVTRSLARCQNLGFAGLVCYVESNNFDSLKSSYRMGYRDCGRIRVARIAAKYLIRADRECDEHGLSLHLNLCGSNSAQTAAQKFLAADDTPRA